MALLALLCNILLQPLFPLERSKTAADILFFDSLYPINSYRSSALVSVTYIKENGWRSVYTNSPVSLFISASAITQRAQKKKETEQECYLDHTRNIGCDAVAHIQLSFLVWFVTHLQQVKNLDPVNADTGR